MILHIPHSGTEIKNRKEYTDVLEQAMDLTDYYTDLLFEHWNSKRIKFEYSRLYCDVERYINDPMEDIGQGILYTKYNNELLREPSQETIKDVYQLYREHHDKFEKIISLMKTLFPENIIVDCHSFSDREGYPDFCIGHNNPPQKIMTLIQEIKDLLENQGYSVKLNDPYQGSIDPEPNDGINSIMIEVNKKLYLKGIEKSEGFDKTKDIVFDILNTISLYEIKADK